MRREATIILPVRGNDGQDLAEVHAMLRERLAETFGGFTAASATGGWANGDAVQTEQVEVYTVAVGEGSDETLRDLCATLAIAADQECVYYRDTSGYVHFVG